MTSLDNFDRWQCVGSERPPPGITQVQGQTGPCRGGYRLPLQGASVVSGRVPWLPGRGSHAVTTAPRTCRVLLRLSLYHPPRPPWSARLHTPRGAARSAVPAAGLMHTQRAFVGRGVAGLWTQVNLPSARKSVWAKTSKGRLCVSRVTGDFYFLYIVSRTFYSKHMWL